MKLHHSQIDQQKLQTKGLKEKKSCCLLVCFRRKHRNRSIPLFNLKHLCACWLCESLCKRLRLRALCVCVWQHVFRQLEVGSRIPSPGGASWGVCWERTPFQIKGLCLWKHPPALELQKWAKATQTPPQSLPEAGAFRLQTADSWLRRTGLQVDLPSGARPSFHYIQVSSQTQTCFFTSLLHFPTPTRPPSVRPIQKSQAFTPDLV